MRKIITISRQFGAGGGELGRRTAEALGIAYYDKDIILNTAKASANLTPAEVRRWDERVPTEFGFAQSLFDFYSRPIGDRIWDAQVTAIRRMAEHESCVIVGRNAEYILKEFDHCLRVFVHADQSWRVARMCGKMPDCTAEQVKADLLTADKGRAAACMRYTGQRYGDSTNYDLTLNTSKLGLDAAFNMILEAAALV